MNYNEQQVLTDYVWQNYPELLTDFEHSVGRAIREQTPARKSSSPRPAPQRADSCWNDPHVAAALAEGAEAYRRRVRDRLLQTHPERIAIARCPQCHRIAARPASRVCFWCGHDWHEKRRAES